MYTPRQALVAHLQTADLADTVKAHEGEIPRAVSQQNPAALTGLMPAALVMIESGDVTNDRFFDASIFMAVRTKALDLSASEDDGLQIVEDTALWLDDNRRFKHDGETFEVATDGAGSRPIEMDLIVVSPDFTIVEVAFSMQWY